MRTLRKARELVRAQWFSPKDFVRHAILISLAFALVQVCGLREFTSILNGTTGSLTVSWEVAALLGVGYVLIYLTFVLLVPALLFAAIISSSWNWIMQRK